MEGLIAAMRGRRAVPTVDVPTASTRTRSVRRGHDELASVAWRAMHVSLSSSSGEDEGCTSEDQEYLERGTVVGRYMVLRELGAGGMGVVYAAYDPELDRKVALKLVLPGRGDVEGRTRLLREAQALAKLSHRNVVAIHDVGTAGGQVWMAMELVRGQTLRAWLRTPRPWREVLAVLLEAGRGLAAAHAAGLLHRDFKPDNVMVGARGSVRVMDFGLARARTGVPTAEESTIEAVPLVDTLALPVTEAGTLLGTPVYMAPEQLLGHEPTAAVDQYALCVTLWEALYGERPFAAPTLDELIEAVVAGKLREPVHGRSVPGWLRRVCERGLATKPEQRCELMETLLDALGRGQARARVRMGVAAVGVLALCGLGAEGWRRWELAQRVAACERSGAEVATAWNDGRREELRAALVATGVSYAATTAEKVMPWLDDYAQAWSEAREEACLDAEVRGRWDAALLERSLWCLDERREQLASLVDELTAADATTVQKAVGAAVGLASVEPCRDEQVLERLGLPSLDQRDAIREARADATRAATLERTGKYAAGLDVARGALARAEMLAWPPLVAAARSHQGSLLAKTGDYAGAETALEDAYFESLGVAPEVSTSAALKLVYVVGVNLARPLDGRRWHRLAEAAAASARDRDRPERTSSRATLATLHLVGGDYHAARRLYEEELAQSIDELGPEHPSLAATFNNLAVARKSMGAYDEAKVLYIRAIAIRSAALGPGHPEVAMSVHNLADLHAILGDYAEAKRLNEEALAIREQALGPGHPDVAQTLDNLASVHATLGNYADARALVERGLAIHERVLGPDHPNVATSLSILASIDLLTGAHAEAKAACERVLTIYERLGPEHPHVSTALVCLGEVALAQARPSDAAAAADRAIALRERAGMPAAAVEEARFLLARARWDASVAGDPERAHAVALADRAREVLRTAGAGWSQELAEVEAWLAAHPPEPAD
jgi:eukaryotic-like serine/threonine-protein kinase